MRVESSVTSLSWIPSEAVTGLSKAVFGTGFTHYDDPPPDQLGDLDELQADDRFRFANQLIGWIDVVDGTVVDAGYRGGCRMGATTVAVGPRQATFAAVAFDNLRRPLELTATSARFVQTVGGRTAVPAPRRVSSPPFLKFEAPTVWTTLALTLHADGSREFELLGASAFPRHWMYDERGTLAAKAGLADFGEWWRHSFGPHTPWGDQDSPALVTVVETALERRLANHIMRGGSRPEVRKLASGTLLTQQGETGVDMYLVLDGVVTIEVDGDVIAELGPGAIVGERAALEGGIRTCTVRAQTKVTVAVVASDQIADDHLVELSHGHRREHADVHEP